MVEDVDYSIAYVVCVIKVSQRHKVLERLRCNSIVRVQSVIKRRCDVTLVDGRLTGTALRVHAYVARYCTEHIQLKKDACRCKEPQYGQAFERPLFATEKQDPVQFEPIKQANQDLDRPKAQEFGPACFDAAFRSFKLFNFDLLFLLGLFKCLSVVNSVSQCEDEACEKEAERGHLQIVRLVDIVVLCNDELAL